MAKDNIKSSGSLTIEVKDKKGKRKGKKLKIKNLVTTAGKAEIAKLFLTDQTSGATAFDYIAIGIGTGAAAIGDTTLGTESMREAGTGTITTTTVTGDTSTLVNEFSITETLAITEYGLLNASSAGTLFSRTVAAAKNVVNGDTITVTWNIAHS